MIRILLSALLLAAPAGADPARVENGVRVHYGNGDAPAAASSPEQTMVRIDPYYRGTTLYRPTTGAKHGAPTIADEFTYRHDRTRYVFVAVGKAPPPIR